MLKGDIMDLAVAIYNDNKNITSIETLDYVKKSGFKNVFIQWYDDKSLSILLFFITIISIIYIF